MAKAKILVVEDNERLRKVCVQLLLKSGYEVLAVGSGEEALARLQEQRFDLLLTDINMPGMPGNLLIDQVRKRQPEILPVIMTGYPTIELAIESVGKGVCEFLTKPFRMEQLQTAIEKTLARRDAEVQRIQRQFAETLVELEQRLGGEFDLQESVESLLEDQAAPAAEAEKRGAVTECLVMFCEPIPRSRYLLQTSPNFRHFRMIYTAHRLLNDQLRKAGTPAAVRLALVSRAAEIPRLFARREHLCGALLGPNFPLPDSDLLRLLVAALPDCAVVLCYNPEKSSLASDQLAGLRDSLGVEILPVGTEDEMAESAWIEFFVREFRPRLERQLELSVEQLAAGRAPLSGAEVDRLIARDRETAGRLPHLSPACQQVIRTMDEGRNLSRVREDLEADPGLRETLLRAARLARDRTGPEVVEMPQALTVLGMMETRRIVLAKGLKQLLDRLDPQEFDIAGFFAHSLCTAQLAAWLALSGGKPARGEQALLEEPPLERLIRLLVQPFRCGPAFAPAAGLDAFAAGLFHDLGKVAQATCYRGTAAFVLYEIERSDWRRSLLASEAGVVGGLQHPGLGAALLKRWGTARSVQEAVDSHHQINPQTTPAGALLGLANCLAKGLYPFPRRIDIPRSFRKKHLDSTVRSEHLDNPLPELFQKLVVAFERHKVGLSLSERGAEEGRVTPENVTALAQAARAAVSQLGEGYLEALRRQNPEIEPLAAWLELPAGELLALNLLLREPLVERTEWLLQVTASIRSQPSSPAD